MFTVGQKVVCVNAGNLFPYYADSPIELVEGKIYTVRWVGPSPHPFNRGVPSVRLNEIIRRDEPLTPQRSDMPWQADRFRPVVERKTDISVFAEMLNKVSEDA
jgi:hypothetical protein